VWKNYHCKPLVEVFDVKNKCWLTILLLVVASAQSALLAGQQSVVRPKDTGAALVNPGMGWILYYYDNSLFRYGGTVDEFPGAGTVYFRLAWPYLEPEEGKFNWSIVDTPAQRWIAKGKRVAFRFTCSDTGASQRYATPEWVRKAGAKGYYFEPHKGIVENGRWWEPDFDDPVFLNKLDQFLAVAAARYDGNPEVAFIDVGSFGVWGEGHTGATTKLPYSAATIHRHINLYRKHFPHTLLVANDGMANGNRGLDVLYYARKLGLTLRDDSILSAPGEECISPCLPGGQLLARVAGDSGVRALRALPRQRLLGKRQPLLESDRSLPCQLRLCPLVPAGISEGKPAIDPPD
jgi:hypothetical protein